MFLGGSGFPLSSATVKRQSSSKPGSFTTLGTIQVHLQPMSSGSAGTPVGAIPFKGYTAYKKGDNTVGDYHIKADVDVLVIGSDTYRIIDVKVWEGITTYTEIILEAADIVVD
jgi:hypothetical protein